MRKFFIIIILLYLSTSYAWSQSTIGILDISPKQGVSAMEADIVTDFVYDALYSFGGAKYDIISRQNREAILEEHKFALSGLCDDTQCAIEVGKYLSADYVIVGSFTKFGSKYYLALQMVDVNTTVVAGSSREGAINLDKIADTVVDKCVAELFNINLHTSSNDNNSTNIVMSTDNRPNSSVVKKVENEWQWIESLPPFLNPGQTSGPLWVSSSTSFRINPADRHNEKPYLFSSDSDYFKLFDYGYPQIRGINKLSNSNKEIYRLSLRVKYGNNGNQTVFGVAIIEVIDNYHINFSITPPLDLNGATFFKLSNINEWELFWLEGYE